MKGSPIDAVISYVLASNEAKELGVNWATFWALGANILTGAQWWSLHKQAQTIRAAEKADGVSLYFFAFLVGYCVSFIYYGWVAHKLTVMLNGLLAIVYLQIVIGIARYRGLTGREIAMLSAVPIMVIAMIIIPRKDIVLLVYLVGIFLFLLDVPLQMVRARKVGQLDIRFSYVFIAVSAFWTCYAYWFSDVPLLIFNPLAIGLYVWTIVLYHKYKKLDGQRKACKLAK